MNEQDPETSETPATFFVDEAGDGVLFGPKGRNRLTDDRAPQFFMLGMVRCGSDADAAAALESRRSELLAHPLYSSIPSAQHEARKTARCFHAKDDHPEIRSKVFELMLTLDFKFSSEHPCLQLADYCLWALQRCYERHESRFLHALWSKVSVIHDVDDPAAKRYGTFLTRASTPPDPEQIKIRWV